MKATIQDEIHNLYLVLTGNYTNYEYEYFREYLIKKYGYDKFRDIQIKAFRKIWE